MSNYSSVQVKTGTNACLITMHFHALAFEFLKLSVAISPNKSTINDDARCCTVI